MRFNYSAACIVSTVSIFASGLLAQVTPIQSSAESDTALNISQSTFSDHPVVLIDQLTTITDLTAMANASMDNEHGLFSGSTRTTAQFNDVESGTVDILQTFQGSQAGGAPKAGGFGHTLVGEFLYDFTLGKEGDIQFGGMMLNSDTVFEGVVLLTIGGFSQSGSFTGNVYQQQIIDTANLGTVPFNFTAALPATTGHYQLSIRLTNSGLGLRNQPMVTSLMNTTFIINSAACLADLNSDDELDFLDISAFVSAFGTHDPLADFNDDGEFDFLDISAFVAAFTAGCP